MDPKLIDFLAIPVVGVLLSMAIQWAKVKFDLSAFGTKVTTAVASIVLGLAYWFLKDTAIWFDVVGVLGSATIFWAWFLKPDQTPVA